MSRRRLTSWLTSPVFGLDAVGPGDLALALVLSVFAVGSTCGLVKPVYPGEGLAAALCVLFMTAPVGFARRYPVPAAATLGAGAAINWGLIGHMVRCGSTLPAVFFVAFVAGSRCPGWRPRAAAIASLAVSLVCQSYSDPNLGVGVLPYMVPITVAFMGAGLVLRDRNQAVARLHALTAELRAQREQNAARAVEADRAVIAGDLDRFLRNRMSRIAAAADAGETSLGSDSDGARKAFVGIQGIGRETLTHMRQVVGNLREAPRDPQPVLAQLDQLVGRLRPTEARLQVTGDARLLPPGVDLSAYRIVEHLLLALEDEPAAPVDVSIAFSPDALELTVVGPICRGRTLRPALSAAAARASLHGGSLSTTARKDRLATVVRLPLLARDT